jgi:hypothetical protein
MTQPIKSDCDRRYFPAYHTSGERLEREIKWVVLHDEESSSAASAAAYFKTHLSGGSAHLCLDDEGCYRCLPNTAIPWGAASSFGANTHGFHIEQAGYAKWSAVLWFSHKRTLERAAYKTAFHCHKFAIPARFVDADGLLRGDRGITTHAEVTKASKKQDPAHAWKYDHTDPGLLWPKKWFVRRVRFYLDELKAGR